MYPFKKFADQSNLPQKSCPPVFLRPTFKTSILTHLKKKKLKKTAHNSLIFNINDLGCKHEIIFGNNQDFFSNYNGKFLPTVG